MAASSIIFYKSELAQSTILHSIIKFAIFLSVSDCSHLIRILTFLFATLIIFYISQQQFHNNMGISATVTSKPTRSSGVTKRRAIPRRESITVRRTRSSRNQYFWHSASDGAINLINNSNNTIPEKVNDYLFVPSQWTREPYPSTFPPGGVWPPQQIDDLICAVGTEYIDCVGNTCYTDKICEDIHCEHTFSAWKTATSDWEQYFELRKTEDRGIGVYTKRAYRKGAILGWYAGQLLTSASGIGHFGDYLMEIEIGALETSKPSKIGPTLYIDAEHKGNWTRFINHSCAADCVFRIMRVGGTRIMAIEAVKEIPRGKELSVDYGSEYYGLDTKKICACGVSKCVGKKRARLERAREKAREERMKEEKEWKEWKHNQK